ncbi:PR domain zinc finger protein 8 [Eumeta japonica]|uniref:PR domain zinc finger protein 8 n=1 Tax=Eumeta variegata TaxID=151549 RepID=A0A4C1YS60_EUMVA|nr:PR domain zinc finger protein 8 [Eumeta japonica]
MDVQNNYQNYKETSPDSRGTNLSIESARTSPLAKSDLQSTILTQGKTLKRSFDVAFLMMPDEKLRQKPPDKQLRVSKQLFSNEEWEQQSKRSEIYKNVGFTDESTADAKDENVEKNCYEDRGRVNNNVSPTFSSDINIDVGTDEYPGGKSLYCSDSENSERSRSRPNSNDSASRPPKFLPESPYKNKIFDDPTLISMQSRARYEQLSRYCVDKPPDMSPKSAFTKVANYSLRSPNPSVSPDNLLYQNSISPPLSAASPPTTVFNKSSPFNNLLTPAHVMNSNNFFKNQSLTNSSNYVDAAAIQQIPRTGSGFGKGGSYHDEKSDHKTIHTSPQSKLNFLPFRPEIPAYLQAGASYPFGVQNFQSPNPDFMKFPVPPREPVNPLIANPAAAILSTLLPPTMAAFSLPAQNVCAKCSISFRMTSDLVYHMRTHHKSESAADPNRRKREEKLKCPVCNESFRERHHLTRHMTAHQDKEGDLDDVPQNGQGYKKSKQFYTHNSNTLIHK